MAGDPVKGDTSSLSALVKDWGGFELLVAKLNETGNVTVEHNVTLPGRSGAPRQIDVLIRHKQGLIEHLVVAECKYRNQPIERLHVDALATTVREVGASKGVIFSTRGFQSGAITQAKHDAIDLFLVREPTDEEWGSPGRIVDFTLLCYQPVIGRIVPGQAWGLDGINEPLSINILIGLSAEDSSQTKIINSPNDETLEKLIIDNVRRSVQGMLPKGRVIQDGSYEVEIRGRSYLNMNFDPPRMMTTGGRTFAMPSIMLEIGFTATQTRFADRQSRKPVIRSCCRGLRKFDSDGRVTGKVREQDGHLYTKAGNNRR